MNQAWYIVLGWLMGLLSPAIIESIRSKRTKTELTEAIYSEFHELQYYVAMMSYDLATSSGFADRAFLQWVYDSIIQYHGVDADRDAASRISTLLSASDMDLANALKSQVNRELFVHMKRIAVPFFDAHTSSLRLYSVRFQQVALDIRRRLDIVNEEIDQSVKFVMMTFGSSGENPVILRDNIQANYSKMVKISRTIVSRIEQLDKLRNEKAI